MFLIQLFRLSDAVEILTHKPSTALLFLYSNTIFVLGTNFWKCLVVLIYFSENLPPGLIMLYLLNLSHALLTLKYDSVSRRLIML